MKSTESQLKSRGYIDDCELEPYKSSSKEVLLELLSSKEPTDRTIAAKLLGQYVDKGTLDTMLSTLIVEKKLYTKIALSEAIGEFGESACESLIKYLGKTGQNQHYMLPEKPFKKKSYPLPRDIISRTICKIGLPALKSLRACLQSGEYHQILEAIDAIGYISYYEKNQECLEAILTLLERYKSDDLVVWKLLRALEAFPNIDVLEILEFYKNAKVEQHRWEAERSIKQIKNRLIF